MTPIGSFESAWESYDHTSGPALIDEMKALYTDTPLGQPNWRLVIGTEDFTSRMISAETTFAKEGESGIRLVVAANLRALQYERAAVSFYFGYGTKLVPYFRGRLASPVDSPNGLYGEATAYGLSTQLGERYFQSRVDYGGWDLREAVADIIDRFGVNTDRIFFEGTHTTELANDIGEFGLEVSLGEALQTILEPMQFLNYDQPGGMHIIDRGHLASLGTDSVFSGAGHYDVEHYFMDGFTFDESMANFYSDVVIFRRKDEFAGGGGSGVAGANSAEPDSDEYAVYTDRANPGPDDGGIATSGIFNVNVGRRYVIADYPGQQEHAERERGLLVTSLERGVGHFEFVHPPLDFSIADHFSVTRIEQIHDAAYFGDHGTYASPQIDAVTYACVVEEITQTVVAKDDNSVGPSEGRWTQTTSGLAFEFDRQALEGGSTTSLGLAVTPFPPVVFASSVVDGADVLVDGANSVVDTP